MKKTLIGLALSLLLFLSGCQNGRDSSSENLDVDNSFFRKDYDICLYNPDSAAAEKMQQLCDDYTWETGVKIKNTFVPKEKPLAEILARDASNPDVATIFPVKNWQELSDLAKDGLVFDFNKSGDQQLKALASEIPQPFRLTLDNNNNFGVPRAVESYGYLVDERMLADLFGEENLEALKADLFACSCEEFQALVKACDQLINNDVSAAVKLNGNEYSLQAPRKGRAKNLEAVYFFGKENYTENALNPALQAVFATPLEAHKATNSQIDALAAPLEKLAQMVNFEREYNGTKQAQVPDNASVEAFCAGKSLFLRDVSSAVREIEKIDRELAERLTMLPAKIPLSKDDIKVKNLSPEEINGSLALSVPYYFALNAHSSELEQKLAQNFLYWLCTSEDAIEHTVKEMQAIPFWPPEDDAMQNHLFAEISKCRKQEMARVDVWPGVDEDLREEIKQEQVLV